MLLRAVPSVQAGIVRHTRPAGFLKNQMSFHLLRDSRTVFSEISTDSFEGVPVIEGCSNSGAIIKRKVFILGHPLSSCAREGKQLRIA